MSLEFISGVRHLTDEPLPMFPGRSGLNVRWVTLKARSNDFVILSNIEEIDGFTVSEEGSIDIPINEVLGSISVFNMNELYWRNNVKGSDAVVEVFGQREV